MLPSRVSDYMPALLDMLCLTGEVSWARVSSGPTQLVGATPVALFLREGLDSWHSLRVSADASALSDAATIVREYLATRGATFFHELRTACSLPDDRLRSALAELVAAGAVTSDGFAGLRALIGGAHHGATRSSRVDAAGRWSALEAPSPHVERPERSERSERSVELFAWTLLHRYGVVFRRLLYRETAGVAWRDLVRVYRRLEAPAEIPGGRFVARMSGETFALPEAVDRLPEIRQSAPEPPSDYHSAAPNPAKP